MLKFIKHTSLLVLLLLAPAVGHSNIISSDGAPGTAFMPLPPDSASEAFSRDFYRWIWGKQQRNTPRGEQARHDSSCDFEQLCHIYSELLDIDIDPSNAPAIHAMLSHVAQASVEYCSSKRPSIMRKRPFVMMNEQPWGENDIAAGLSDSTAYPSGHAVMVWSTALALAQMAPHMQDTILSRAMQCATSGVITGAHWQSDVDAAILYSSAAIAHDRSTTMHHSLLESAHTEYLLLKGLTEDDITAPLPLITKILDTPPGLDDLLFAPDLENHWSMAALRQTERGQQARDDYSISQDYLVSTFAQCSPVVTISQSETPAIAILINTLKLSLSGHATTLKSMVPRQRPYVQLGEPKPYSGSDWPAWGESSYPSRRAMIGWGIALALAEVMTDCQDAILKRGYEYGESRIILGSNYASDVDAARVIAAADLAKLRNEPLFKNLFNYAKNEYRQKLDEASLESIIATSRLNSSLWYSINGVIYNSKPSTPGLYINGGKKVLIK